MAMMTHLRLALEPLERTAVDCGMQLNSPKVAKVMVYCEQPSAAQQAGASVRVRLGAAPSSSSTRSATSRGLTHGSAQPAPKMHARPRVAFNQLHRRNPSDKHVSSLPIELHLYRAVVVSTLVYGAAETWAPTSSSSGSLTCSTPSASPHPGHPLRPSYDATWHRLITGPNVPSNAGLYGRTAQQPISTLLHPRRLAWLGHVGCLPDSDPAEQLLFATAPAPPDGPPPAAPGAARPRCGTRRRTQTLR